ncbi:MAG: hypothetical protein M1823_002257 [Watsoniomyces obsoletus]|nr:MAG: hypothetical protein M1823_002257 [Watsoniomyces obsoletus]
MSADDKYEAQNDVTRADVPSGDITSKDYVSSGPVPVQKDDAPVEDPIDEGTADTDAQLERDDREAIDQSNIIKDRTRHAKPVGSYSEGPDEGDLPKAVADGDDGTSNVRKQL